MNRILIVDDEASIRDALVRWFTLRGFEVDMAEDGQQAVDKCRAGVYDVITMDLEMPRLPGSKAIAIINDMHPDIPIVVLTGYPNEAANLLDNGAAKVLTKPLQLKKLEEEVLQVLKD